MGLTSQNGKRLAFLRNFHNSIKINTRHISVFAKKGEILFFVVNCQKFFFTYLLFECSHKNPKSVVDNALGHVQNSHAHDSYFENCHEISENRFV